MLLLFFKASITYQPHFPSLLYNPRLALYHPYSTIPLQHNPTGLFSCTEYAPLQSFKDNTIPHRFCSNNFLWYDPGFTNKQDNTITGRLYSSHFSLYAPAIPVTLGDALQNRFCIYDHFGHCVHRLQQACLRGMSSVGGRLSTCAGCGNTGIDNCF